MNATTYTGRTKLCEYENRTLYEIVTTTGVRWTYSPPRTILTPEERRQNALDDAYARQQDELRDIY